LACCKMRAKRLDGLGVDHEAIAEMFEVPVKTVGAWVRSNVTVIAKG
jgi:transposase